MQRSPGTRIARRSRTQLDIQIDDGLGKTHPNTQIDTLGDIISAHRVSVKSVVAAKSWSLDEASRSCCSPVRTKESSRTWSTFRRHFFFYLIIASMSVVFQDFPQMQHRVLSGGDGYMVGCGREAYCRKFISISAGGPLVFMVITWRRRNRSQILYNQFLLFLGSITTSLGSLLSPVLCTFIFVIIVI